MSDKHVKAKVEKSEITEALTRVLGSDVFARSERARELLKYLVEQEMGGGASRLKGFSIAQDVFGKSDEFDPQTDAVVRVQAGRLRDSLASYYSDEGSNDPVQISVPVGSYVPTYERHESAVAPSAEETVEEAEPTDANVKMTLSSSGDPTVPVSSFVVRNLRAIWFVLFLIVALLAAILYGVWSTANAPSPDRAQTQRGPSITSASESLPKVEIVLRSAPDDSVGLQWLRRVTNAASRFPVVRLSSRPVGFSSADDESVDFISFLDVRDEASVDIEVVARKDGVTVWSSNVVMDGTPLNGLNHSFSGALTALLAPSGKLYTHLAQNGELRDLARCLWLTNAFYQNQDSGRYLESINCHERLVSENTVSPLAFADMASLLVERINDGYEYPEKVSRDDSYAFARKSIESGTTPEGYRALGIALSLFDDDVGREEAYRKAYTLNPFDLELAAAYGWSLLKSRAFDEAAIILENVLLNAPFEHSWWSYSLFISAFVSGDMDAADLGARKLAGSPRPHYLAARAIMADIRGRTELRNQLTAKLRLSSSRIAQDPAKYYTRLYGEEASAILSKALAEAGYSGKEVSR